MSRSTTRDDTVTRGATADPTVGLRERLDDLSEGYDTLEGDFDGRDTPVQTILRFERSKQTD